MESNISGISVFHLGIGLRLQSSKQRQDLPESRSSMYASDITVKSIDTPQFVAGQPKNARIGPQIYKEVNREE